MDKLSGLVLDVYDDPDGAVLREVFPSFDDVPELIKEARQITSEEREQLPDDAFSLVLIDGDTRLRKYACTDAGNTAISVEYFMKTAHRLPAEAQQVAAQNLVTACGWYDIEPPEELQKVAIGLGGALGVLAAPSVAKGTHEQIQKNKARARMAGGRVDPGVAGAGFPKKFGPGATVM